MSSNRVAADDNPVKLMGIAMKPLISPPFPPETMLMNGEKCENEGSEAGILVFAWDYLRMSAIFADSCCIALGISMPCGQTAVHAPQPTQL